MAAASNAQVLQLFAYSRQAGFVERRHHFAVGTDALLDLEAERPFDQRLVLLKKQIVGVGSVDTPDLIDVAKAVGRNQRSLGAGALQDRVDGNCRAMQEEIGGGVIAAGLQHACGDAVDQPIRR